MVDARPDATHTFETVVERLAEAGMTLLALHVTGTRPAGYRCFWPDIQGAIADDTRPPPPPAKRISRMDEALTWISLIPGSQTKLRKLVAARALTNPRTEKPVFSWHQLGTQMGCSHKTAKTWWIAAVEMIVERLNHRLSGNRCGITINRKPKMSTHGTTGYDGV